MSPHGQRSHATLGFRAQFANVSFRFALTGLPTPPENVNVFRCRWGELGHANRGQAFDAMVLQEGQEPILLNTMRGLQKILRGSSIVSVQEIGSVNADVEGERLRMALVMAPCPPPTLQAKTVLTADWCAAMCKGFWVS